MCERKTYQVLFFAPCKGIQDSLEFWFPCRGFRIPITGFKIFFSETWIPDSSCSRILDSYNSIPDSKAQDSGFHKQKFRGFRNLDFLTWGDVFIPVQKLSGIV